MAGGTTKKRMTPGKWLIILLLIAMPFSFFLWSIYRDKFPPTAPEEDVAAIHKNGDSSTEGITRFLSHIRLRKNGIMAVRSSVTVRATTDGQEIRHGIYMTLARHIVPFINEKTPLKHLLGMDQRAIEYRIERVAAYRVTPAGLEKTLYYSDTPADHVSFENGKLKICLWCDGPELRPGLYRYVVDYAAQAPLNTGDWRDTLNWPITGSAGWSLPIEQAKAVVSLPGNTAPGDVQAAGWLKTADGAARRVEARYEDASTLTVRSPQVLEPGAALSFAMRLPHGRMAQQSEDGSPSFRLPFLIVLLLMMAFVFYALTSPGSGGKGGGGTGAVGGGGVGGGGAGGGGAGGGGGGC